MVSLRPKCLFHADLTGSLLHGHQHDVHQANARNAQRERSHHGKQHLQGNCQHVELSQLRHQVGHVDGVVVRGPEVMSRSHGLAQTFLDQLIVAAIREPDGAKVMRVNQIAHGVEGNIYLAIAVVVALLHLGAQHANHGKDNAIEANSLADGPAAGEQLCLGLRPDYADVGPLLILGAIEEAALVGIQLEDVLKDGANAVYGPGVSMQIVLHGRVLPHLGRDVKDALNAVGDPVHIFHGEANPDAGLVAARLLTGAAGKEADQVGSPLGEDVLNGTVKSGAIPSSDLNGIEYLATNTS